MDGQDGSATAPVCKEDAQVRDREVGALPMMCNGCIHGCCVLTMQAWLLVACGPAPSSVGTNDGHGDVISWRPGGMTTQRSAMNQASHRCVGAVGRCRVYVLH